MMGLSTAARTIGAGLLLGLSMFFPGPARSQVEHVLPPDSGKDLELDPEALKRVRPMERNLTVLPPEVLVPNQPTEPVEPPKYMPGR